MEKMHNFYYVNTFINNIDIYHWMFLLFTPLDYYLSTYYGESSIVLAYLCRKYFLEPYYNFVGCNLDPE